MKQSLLAMSNPLKYSSCHFDEDSGPGESTLVLRLIEGKVHSYDPSLSLVHTTLGETPNFKIRAEHQVYDEKYIERIDKELLHSVSQSL